MLHEDELKEKFDVHPLIFQRSKEHSKSPGELYDILVTIPEFPIVWDSKKQKWTQPDLFFTNKLDSILG